MFRILVGSSGLPCAPRLSVNAFELSGLVMFHVKP